MRFGKSIRRLIFPAAIWHFAAGGECVVSDRALALEAMIDLGMEKDLRVIFLVAMASWRERLGLGRCRGRSLRKGAYMIRHTHIPEFEQFNTPHI